jgi:hypothetical protein
MCAFLHSPRVGFPWDAALNTFGSLPDGFLSGDGRIFDLPVLRLPEGRPDRCIHLADPGDADSMTIFFGPAGLAAIASSQPFLPRRPPVPSANLVVSPRGVTLSSRFLPPYIKLLKRPSRDVMSVFRAADAWHRRLGPLDATAAAVVGGQLTMPKPRLALRPSRRPNHASWERNEAAKIALGPKFATWT